MRLVLITVAALMILGLAAFGVVSAKRMAGQDMTSADAHIGATSPGATSSGPVAAPRTPVSQPVSQIAQATGLVVPSNASDGSAAQTRLAQSAPAASQAGAADPSGANKPATTIAPCDKPGGMGLARVVEIDTTGGPGFGFEHFKQYDFLRDEEVVLTFDDGPWL